MIAQTIEKALPAGIDIRRALQVLPEQIRDVIRIRAC